MGETGGDFVIDFEEGPGGTPWGFDSITDSGAIMTVGAAGAAHESNGMILTFDDAAIDSYGDKDLSSPKTTLYKRLYFKMSSDLSQPGFQSPRLVKIYDGGSAIVHFGTNRGASGDGPPTRWFVSGTGIASGTPNTNFTLNAWHYIDIEWIAGTGSDGQVRIWVDGDLAYSDLALDLSAYEVDRVRVGIDAGAPNNSGNWYIDDIKADDTGPIGAYSVAAGGKAQMIFISGEME